MSYSVRLQVMDARGVTRSCLQRIDNQMQMHMALSTQLPSVVQNHTRRLSDPAAPDDNLSTVHTSKEGRCTPGVHDHQEAIRLAPSMNNNKESLD